MLPSIFTRNNDNQLRYLSSNHPFIELRHDFLDVGFDLVVGGNEHREAIFFDGGEVFGGVDASLEAIQIYLSASHLFEELVRVEDLQNCVYGVLKLFLLVPRFCE